MKKWIKLSASAAAIVFVLAACGSNGDAGSGPSKEPSASSTQSGQAADAVEIRQFNFNPLELTVKAGTTVTWTNRDAILHTVTSGTGPDGKTGEYDGQLGDAGVTFSFTYDTAGTYEYFCSRHSTVPGMHGTVIVT